MGWLRNMSSQIKDAMAVGKELESVAAEAHAGGGATVGAGAAGAAPSGPPEILYATPQHEIDRLASGGAPPVRGILVAVKLPDRFTSEGSVDKVQYGTVTATVRARLAGGEFGPPATDKRRMVPWKVHELLEVGLEVPIVATPDGVVSSLDWDALAVELEPRVDEARAKISARRGKLSDVFDPIREAASLPGALKEYFQQPTPENPVASDDDPLMESVGTVTWERYVNVMAVAQSGRTGRSIEQIAAAYGIEASEWSGGASAWPARLSRSVLVAERFGRDLADANQRVRNLRREHGKEWFPAHLP